MNLVCLSDLSENVGIINALFDLAIRMKRKPSMNATKNKEITKTLKGPTLMCLIAKQ
jgi:hypothetical protein